MHSLLSPIASKWLRDFTQTGTSTLFPIETVIFLKATYKICPPLGFKSLITDQRNQAENVMMYATFFTGTAVSTLQLSYSLVGNPPLLDPLNILWFLSLVFSLGAAGIGLVSVTWTNSMK